MSLEAVKMVTQAEQDAKARKVQAAADARKLVADAEKAGRQSVADALAKAKAEAAEQMAQAEQKAASARAKIIRETEGTCDQLRAEAQVKLEKAASLIVRRVVEG